MYQFSFGSLFIGLIIMVIGTLVSVFYRTIGDNLASGASSYENVKKFGLIAIGVGFVVALSLHTLILNLIVNIFFRRG